VIKEQVSSTLFVCSANQCRSPMAEGLLKDLIIAKDPTNRNWMVASAGCWAYPHMPAIGKAIKAVSEMGIDISDHSSQALTGTLLERFNLVLCMEMGHVDFIKRHFPKNAKKVYLLSKMVGEDFEIEDPIGKSQSDYYDSALEIFSILDKGWEQIKKLSAR